MKWQQKGRQFDQIADQILHENCEYYIWGAGVFGESFYQSQKNELKICGFIDSNVQKQKVKCCGLPVYSPSILLDKKDNRKILVSAGWTKEIFSRLEHMGYVMNYDFFHIDEFLAIYMMYKYNKLYLTSLTYIITEMCTFRCKNCSGFYPYYKNPKNYPVEEILQDLALYFQWVDQVNVLGLCGGDAMLHPQFDEILTEIGERYYKKQVCDLEIYSNAVIIPTEQQLELFKRYNVFYRFTDYGDNVGNRQKIDEIKNLLEKYKIRYDHVKFTKWYDSGYPQESNGIVGEENLIQFFDQCNRRSCQVLTKGKFFYCGAARNASDIDYCRASEEDYYDLYPYKAKHKKELMEFALGYSVKGYLNYCTKCNGGQNINNHTIESGIQL